eukprot:2527707-Prymnesium_polylepis.1
MRLICHPTPPRRRTDALGSSSHQMRIGRIPTTIVVVIQDIDCPTTGSARGTRPALKPSHRAPYHAVK